MKENLTTILFGILILVFLVFPIITLLVMIFKNSKIRFSRGVPEPPKKLRDRYNDKYADLSASKQKNSSFWENRENTRTEKSNDLVDAIAIGLLMNDNTEETVKLTAEDNNQILEKLGMDKGFDGGFGGGGFSGSGASGGWQEDNSSSYSSSSDYGSSSSSDSSSYDSSSSGSDF